MDKNIEIEKNKIKCPNCEKEFESEKKSDGKNLEIVKCPHCGKTFSLGKCPHCGSTNVYGMSRIVGYFSKINNWNASKRAEFKDRQKGRYSV